MAIYNEILAPRFSAMLQRLLSMKGEQAVKQLSGEIIPVFPMFLGREARLLEGWQTYAWFTIIAASAANLGIFRIRNPVPSGVVTIIEKLYAASSAPGLGLIAYDGTLADQGDLAVTAGPQTLDQRNANGVGHSATILSSKNSTPGGSPGTTIGSFGPFNANQTVDFIVTDIQEMPLLPGSFYDVTAPAVNTTWEVGVIFRERVLEPSELRG